MDLKQIVYFMWVYEEGSFSKAALKAHVVQPALSMQIRRLEEEFGVQLFERGPRGVAPTPAGRKLYQRCVPIARNFALAKQELAEAAQAETLAGELRVGLPGSFNRGLLQSVLLPFMERYPEVNITISEAYTGTLIDWVRDGRVDFALGARPSLEGGLVQRLVYRDRVVLMSGSPLNGPMFAPCDLTRIENLKLILPARHQSFGAIVRSYIKNGEIKVERLIEINGTVGAFEVARASEWGVLTPFVSVFKELSSEELFVYPIETPAIPFDLYLVYDQRRPPNGVAKRFIEAVEVEFRRLDQIWHELISARDPGDVEP